MDTSQRTVRFDEQGSFLKNQLRSIVSMKWWFLYMGFQKLGIHTFGVYLNILLCRCCFPVSIFVTRNAYS